VSESPPRTVAAPHPPERPGPHRFPLVATIAPLVVSVALFAVTRSAFSLVFAGLGPVVAMASTADAALHRRHASHREAARFASEVSRAAGEIDAAHAAERAERCAAVPTAHVLTHGGALAERAALVVPRWRVDRMGAITLRIGTGITRSTLVFDASGSASRSDDEWAATVDELRNRAAALQQGAIVAEVVRGVGVVGSPRAAAAVARGLAIQLAGTLSPALWSVIGGPDAGWMRGLPHRTNDSAPTGTIEFRSGSERIRIETARAAAGLTGEVDVILELRADGWLNRPSPECAPEFIGVQAASAAAAVLAEAALEAGIRSSSEPTLPAHLELESLAQVSRTLAAAVGVSAGGPVTIDLVSDGPHAIVAGTTGSGKSELLLSWVVALATERAPSAVTFLFVDFKGGASFGPLRDLPHSVGVITDLDADQAARALISLSAELRFRERELARLGLRSITEGATGPFPRLVVVVDEFAALLATLPELHALFSDIAARGRSLGVHLVLCTQRPAGVVRDGILANCSLRLSLRVAGVADSVAVLGTGAAASLPARPVGRALVSTAGEPPVAFQVARSTAADVARAMRRWTDAPRPRSPWLPPLPAELDLDMLTVGEPTDDLPFALADYPAEQAQRVARYVPRRHGPLLVIGGPRSGKSGLLAALAAVPSSLDVVRVPPEPAGLWDVAHAALDAQQERDRVLLLDDVDATLAGAEEVYQRTLVDLLARLIREGPAFGVFCVLTTARPSGALSGLAALCGPPVVLALPSRADHALAGADPATFVAHLPPGAGHWRGTRIQIPRVPSPPFDRVEPPAAREVNVAVATIAVVSTRPEPCATALRALAAGRSVVVLASAAPGMPRDELEVSRGGAPVIIVADPDQWQAEWGVYAELQRRGDILFDGCSPTDFRALTRSRELPPPFPRGQRALWLRARDGTVTRARLTGEPPSVS
jgi:DNA segregation ATPase FtsK/SpoIIIE, S-DNA-T family